MVLCVSVCLAWCLICEKMPCWLTAAKHCVCVFEGSIRSQKAREIAFQMQMQVINLSDNKLVLPETVDACKALPQMPSLEALVLNDCDVTWQQVSVY